MKEIKEKTICFRVTKSEAKRLTKKCGKQDVSDFIRESVLGYWWCEACNKRWEGFTGLNRTCPFCKSDEIRKTLSPEEAEKRGLKVA